MTQPEPIPLCRKPRCRVTPKPGYADRGLCPGHERGALEAIADLPADWSALGVLLFDKPVRGMSAVGGAPFGPRDPINNARALLQAEIQYALDQWAEIVRDRASLSPPAGRTAYALVRSNADTLHAHFPVLISTPATDLARYDDSLRTIDGVDAIVLLAQLHHRATAQVGMSVRETALQGACIRCGREALRHRDGSDTVWCQGCGEIVSWDDYMDSITLIPLTAA